MTFLILSLVVGVKVTLSGPAFDEARARRQARRDIPRARVAFMLPSAVGSTASDVARVLR